MLSQTVSIVFTMGFISAVSGLDTEQSAYKAAFKCFKAGHDADAHSLEAKGMNANKEEMIESSCLFAKAFATCISELDPSVFSSQDPNIAHYLVAFEWQHMVLENKANFCPDELPVDKLKEIASASGVLEREGLSNVENDHYEQYVGDALKKCIVSASIRFEHHLDNNFLTAFESYSKCYEEAAKDCNPPMLQHFVAIIKLHKKYFEEKNGKFEEMLSKLEE